jgi:hypothetical protein
MTAPAYAGAFALRDDQLADAIVSAGRSDSGGGHPGRDGGRHQTMRHWITSFQLSIQTGRAAVLGLIKDMLNFVEGSTVTEVPGPLIGALAIHVGEADGCGLSRFVQCADQSIVTARVISAVKAPSHVCHELFVRTR